MSMKPTTGSTGSTISCTFYSASATFSPCRSNTHCPCVSTQSDVCCLCTLLQDCGTACDLQRSLAGVGARHHLAKMPPTLGRWLAEAEADMETEAEAEAEIAPSAVGRLIPLPMLLLPLLPLLWRCYCLPLLLLPSPSPSGEQPCSETAASPLSYAQRFA
ncbi:hypothetical protein B484DRAFT_233401 [Ochromonadaceae sp. CCMP2298]|nr:hypothetical protein B484DRAFT_233401 [Ochromonadaceae sp. CCMP2298]